jgi:hypothetical protein
MRFFERPGGFVGHIIPQIVQKEKRQTRKPAASMRFREKTHPIEITVSHIKHFVNAFEPVAYRRPAVMCLCCNVRQRKPLNVSQKSNLSVYPPKRCVLDGGGHLLSIKSLQRSGQHYTSHRHRQHRARKAAAALRRCAPYCQCWQNGDKTSPVC